MHRDGGIRTRDPFHPKEVRYRAAPRPVRSLQLPDLHGQSVKASRSPVASLPTNQRKSPSAGRYGSLVPSPKVGTRVSEALSKTPGATAASELSYRLSWANPIVARKSASIPAMTLSPT